MQWLIDNWVWVLFGSGMVAMHLFGHRGHGGRGSRGKGDNDASQTARSAEPQNPIDGNPDSNPRSKRSIQFGRHRDL